MKTLQSTTQDKESINNPLQIKHTRSKSKIEKIIEKSDLKWNMVMQWNEKEETPFLLLTEIHNEIIQLESEESYPDRYSQNLLFPSQLNDVSYNSNKYVYSKRYETNNSNKKREFSPSAAFRQPTMLKSALIRSNYMFPEPDQLSDHTKFDITDIIYTQYI